jgi:hypothetical protein
MAREERQFKEIERRELVSVISPNKREQTLPGVIKQISNLKLKKP